MLKCKCSKEDKGFKIMLKKTNKLVYFRRDNPNEDFLVPDISLTKEEEDYLMKNFDMPGRELEIIKETKTKKEGGID